MRTTNAVPLGRKRYGGALQNHHVVRELDPDPQDASPQPGEYSLPRQNQQLADEVP